jgi:hypothetical protein
MIAVYVIEGVRYRTIILLNVFTVRDNDERIIDVSPSQEGHLSTLHGKLCMTSLKWLNFKM